jgi:hypothetical protein
LARNLRDDGVILSQLTTTKRQIEVARMNFWGREFVANGGKKYAVSNDQA